MQHYIIDIQAFKYHYIPDICVLYVLNYIHLHTVTSSLQSIYHVLVRIIHNNYPLGLINYTVHTFPSCKKYRRYYLYYVFAYKHLAVAFVYVLISHQHSVFYTISSKYNELTQTCYWDISATLRNLWAIRRRYQWKSSSGSMHYILWIHAPCLFTSCHFSNTLSPNRYCFKCTLLSLFSPLAFHEQLKMIFLSI